MPTPKSTTLVYPGSVIAAVANATVPTPRPTGFSSDDYSVADLISAMAALNVTGGTISASRYQAAGTSGAGTMTLGNAPTTATVNVAGSSVQSQGVAVIADGDHVFAGGTLTTSGGFLMAITS